MLRKKSLLTIFLTETNRKQRYFFVRPNITRLENTITNVSKTQFTVAEWLTHLTATLEVMGLRPTLGDISDIYFLESIVSGAQELKMVCVTLWNLMRTAMTAVLTGT